MMFGRKDELAYLNELYESNTFEFLIMYGRRRVGKTTILQEFAMNKNAIFFPVLTLPGCFDFFAFGGFWFGCLKFICGPPFICCGPPFICEP